MKKLISLLLVGLFATQGVLFFLPKSTLAQSSTTGTWIDRSAISLDGSVYFDNSTDTSYNYFKQNDADSCPDEIHEIRDNNTKAKLKVRKPQSFNQSNCESLSDNSISLSNEANSYSFFKWISKTTIMTSDEKVAFEKGEDGGFYELGGDKCKDTITLQGEDISKGVLIPRTGGQNTAYDSEAYNDGPNPIDPSGVEGIGGGCREYDSINIVIARTNDASKEATEGTTNSGDGAPTATVNSENNSCEAQGGVLGWIMCPVILMIDSALNWVDTEIQALLEIDSNYYDNPGMRRAWATIRNAAYLLLVPTMLIMVIGTALGFEFVSAYTARKAFPRMVIATMFIALSYSICTFMIVFTNEIGASVLGLLTAPFGEHVSTLSLADLFGGSVFSALWSIPMTIGVVLLLSFFGGTLLLTAASGFLVLMVRQMFIVLLLLAAPLAVLSWIFPGNDKPWKLWWGLFTKLLIMYPLIMAVIALGRIFAVIINDSGGAGLEGSILNPIMKLIAYMIPYALIPLTFRFAGGLFANLTGIVNDRSKGLFDRQKQRRADKAHRWQGGRAFKNAPEGGVRSWTNRRIEQSANINKAGLNPLQMRSRLNAGLSNAAYDEAREAMEKNSDFKAISGNDDFLEAGRTGEYRYRVWNAATHSWDEQVGHRDGSEGSMRQYLQRLGTYNDDGTFTNNYTGDQINGAVASLSKAKRSMSTHAFDIASTIGIAGTGTGYGGGIGELYKAINETAGGDRVLANRMLADTRGLAERARRPDLVASGFGASSREMQTVINSGNSFAQADASTARQDENTLHTQDPRTIISAKPAMLRRLAPMMQQEIQTALASGDQLTADTVLAKYAAMYDQMSATSPESAQVMARNVLNQQVTTQGTVGRDGQVTPGPGLTSVRDAIEQARNRAPDARGNQTFLNLRREYGSRFAADAAAGLAPPPAGPEG